MSSEKRICPECGNRMWGSYVFGLGLHWNCECGYYEYASEEEERECRRWLTYYRIARSQPPVTTA